MGDTPPLGSVQALHYDYVPDVVERRAAHREAHLALARRFREEGRLVMGGALGDPPQAALLVFRDEASAREFASVDPYVAAGIVTAWRVEPWNVVV
jgi:uncharacterized protein YciI